MKLRKNPLLQLFAAAVALLCLLALPQTAQAASESDLTFTLNETQDGYIVSACDKSATGELSIPATHNGLPITGIGELAFYACTGLSGTTIPDGVITIGYGAFYGCTGLTSVTIPDSIITIGNYAFLACTSLTSITLPDSVTTIDDGAFNHCLSLTEIWVDNNNPAYSNDDQGVLYNKDKTTLIQVPGAICGTYVIPDSITRVAAGAFNGCYNLSYNNYNYGNYLGTDSNPYMVLVNISTNGLSSYTLHSDTKIIGDAAFAACSSLTNITLPDSVTTIGTDAFAHCTNLTSITLPDSVTSIGGSAFYGCTNLTSVTIPDSVTSIGNLAFQYCSNLTNVIIGNSVTRIGTDTFLGCSSLTNVTIPDSIIIIDDYAFSDCSSLTNIIIPDSVTAIGDGAFYGACLTSVVYCGTQEQWGTVSKGDYNSPLINATIQFHNFENGVCAICQATQGSTCQHKWQVATCESPKTCTLCQETDGNALGHDMKGTAAAVEPTCTVNGKTAVLTCTNGCGKTEGGEEIPAIGHKMEETAAAVASTCTATGKTAVLVCANCGKTEGGEEVPALPHDFQNGTCVGCGKQDGVAGDTDGNGKVNLKDAILVLKAVNGGDASADLTFADVNGDGKVNLKDAILILRYANGTPFPAGE